MTETPTSPPVDGETLRQVISAGLDSCDLTEVANEDIISQEHLRIFMRSALSKYAALTRPAGIVEAFKWLDPECGVKGCQSLVWKGRYESAVNGRREFRQAYRETRSVEAPVAWQWRVNIGGQWGRWIILEDDVEEFKKGDWSFNFRNGTAEVRPLYASPPPPDTAVREALERIKNSEFPATKDVFVLVEYVEALAALPPDAGDRK